VYEASSDAPNSWVNGTNLISTSSHIFPKPSLTSHRHRPLRFRGKHPLPQNPRRQQHRRPKPLFPADLLRLQRQRQHASTSLAAQRPLERLHQLLVHANPIHQHAARRRPRQRLPDRHVRQRKRRRELACVSCLRGYKGLATTPGYRLAETVRGVLQEALLEWEYEFEEGYGGGL
jgi:hypothetical protein